jgi:hypothetical protein
MRRTVALAALLVAAACRTAKDETAERLVEKAIAAAGREASVEIDRARGAILVEMRGELKPEGWPADIPVYPDATRLRAHTDEPALRLSLAADDPAPKLAAFYRDELAAAGWAIGEVETGGRTIRARKAERTLVASVTPRDGGKTSRVEIRIGEEDS